MSKIQSTPTTQGLALSLAAFADLVESEAHLESLALRCPFEPPTEESHALFEPAKDFHIATLDDLVNADRVIDAMGAAQMESTEPYWALVQKAKAFFQCNPELLMHPWVHGGGTIFDMHRVLSCRADLVAQSVTINQARLH